MSNQRTARIPMRVHEGTKVRWLSVMEREGYHNLTQLIEATMEDRWFPETGETAQILPLLAEASALPPVWEDAGSADEAGRAGDSVDEPENEVTPGDEVRFPETGQTVPATPAHPVGGEPVAPVAPRRAVFTAANCPLKKGHRSGWKCRGCGEMIE